MVLSWVGGDCAGVLTVRVKQAVVRIERGWARVIAGSSAYREGVG